MAKRGKGTMSGMVFSAEPLSYLHYSPDDEMNAILNHPFGIAIFLGIFAGRLPPCKKLSARLAEKLRQPLSRSGHPLLWKSLTWLPFLIIMVLTAMVEDTFLDGSGTRFLILLAVDTAVYGAFMMIQEAVWSALTPPDETSSDPSDDE